MASELFKTAMEDAEAEKDTTTTTTESKSKKSDPDPYCCTPPEGDPGPDQ